MVVVVVPVPSQVIVGRTISKKQMLMSVCTKIGIQLNVKLGGEAWAVEIPVSCDICLVCIFSQVRKWLWKKNYLRSGKSLNFILS